MERPIEIDQNWRMKSYDWKNRKAIFYPVVFARQNTHSRKVPIKRDVWIDWIKKGWLHTTDHMREWLDENGYVDVKEPSS